MAGEVQAAPFAGRTAWARSIQTPLRNFLRTETGGAAVLLAATLAALAWVNVDASLYDCVWTTTAVDRARRHRRLADLREWVNSGLMTFFFFVVGLEARREFDLGELRERRRLALPLAAGHRRDGRSRSRSTSRSTPALPPRTAGASRCRPTPRSRSALLALVGPRFPDRLRAFMLTVVVVDDLSPSLVIAIVYTDDVTRSAAARRDRRSSGSSSPRTARGPLRARVRWCSAPRSGSRCSSPGSSRSWSGSRWGCSPSPTRPRASSSSGRRERFREFREQPTPELARSVGVGLREAVSPNERLQLLFHPWTSY